MSDAECGAGKESERKSALGRGGEGEGEGGWQPGRSLGEREDPKSNVNGAMPRERERKTDRQKEVIPRAMRCNKLPI